MAKKLLIEPQFPGITANHLTGAVFMQQKVAQSLADTRPNVSHKLAMSGVQAVINLKRKKHAAKAAA